MLCFRLLYAIVRRQMFMMCARARARVCAIHWHCSAQLSMFNMEKRYRNKIIIIIIIIIIKVIIIIIIFVLKGTVKDFLQSHCAANHLQHVPSSGPGAIVCKSHAKHQAHITCNMLFYVPRSTKGQLSN